MKCRRLISAAACALLFSGCAQAPEKTAVPPPAVKTAAVTTRTVELTAPLTGRAESAASVKLRSLVDGRVERISAADGAHIKAGATLIELGGERVEMKRRALDAACVAARENIAAAEELLRQAKRRENAHLAAAGEVARAEMSVASAKAARESAQAVLDRFDKALMIDAPSSGRFTGRRVSPGEEVLAGEVLGELFAPKQMRISAEVLLRAGLEVFPPQEATLELGNGRSLGASVQAVRAEVGAAGTTEVWLIGDDLSRLAPGTVVRGSVLVATHEDAITVPPGAIVFDREDRPLVYVGERPPYERREVKLGQRGEDWVEITAGLGPGDVVVVEGAYELYWAEFGREFKVED